MPNRLSRFADGIMEACWLLALIVTPLFFNIYSSRVFEPDKIALLRSLALVAGAAWAQHRGISAVQVQVDGGGWQDATLANVASIDTWRLWSWRWAATPGEHSLEVRAADNAGDFQTAEVAPPIPDGATGYHRITVVVR